MNSQVQYELALSRQAELLRRAANYRRAAGAQSAPSASPTHARHGTVRWPLGWLQRPPSRSQVV
jgi:hypothetical protein